MKERDIDIMNRDFGRVSSMPKMLEQRDIVLKVKTVVYRCSGRSCGCWDLLSQIVYWASTKSKEWSIKIKKFKKTANCG